MQPPGDPQGKGEEDLRPRRTLKRKIDEYDRDDNNRSNSARDYARMKQDRRNFHKGPGGHPESDEEADQNDHQGDASDEHDDDEEKDLNAPSLLEAVRQTVRLIAEDLQGLGEPAQVPAARREQDVEAHDDGQNNVEVREEPEEPSADTAALAAARSVAVLKAELAKAKEENRRLMEKNNELITLRTAAERKLREARRVRTVHRNEEELPDVSWDLEVQRGETIRMHGLTEAFRKRLDETRDERDDAEKRAKRFASERNEAERLLDEANATIKNAKEDWDEVAQMLDEADTTIQRIQYMCDNRGRDEAVTPLEEANATIMGIQYLCVHQEP